jgi:hypothetical protein
MFDLQPPRHISTLRIFPVAERRGQSRLTEPLADALFQQRERVFVPHTRRSQSSSGSAQMKSGHSHPIYAN